MIKTSLPKISIAIPTYNEEKNISFCLKSVFSQNYPRRLLEIIIIDDYSTDQTLKIVKRFPVKVIFNGSHDAERGKMLGFNIATGYLFYYLDADVELKGTRWFQKMIYPLTQNNQVVGSFTRKYARPTSSSLERYFAMEPLHRDPVYELFSPSIDSTIVENCDNYKICQFTPDKIPPAGRCLYRKNILEAIIRGSEKFLELDILKLLVERGWTKFAYVPVAGLYHHHVKSLSELISKRKRNVQKVYLPDIDRRGYRWFNLGSPKDIAKIFLLIFYAHTFVFSTLRGIIKSLKHKDLAGLWEPLVTIIATDIIMISFLFNKKGLRFIINSFKKLK